MTMGSKPTGFSAQSHTMYTHIIPTTGDEEPELDLSELVEKQQVAWLHHEAVPDTTPRGAPKPKPKPKRNYSDDEEEYLEEEEDDDEAELDDDDDDFDPRYADAKSPRKKAKKKKPRTSSMPQQARWVVRTCGGVLYQTLCHYTTCVQHCVDTSPLTVPPQANATTAALCPSAAAARSSTQRLWLRPCTARCYAAAYERTHAAVACGAP